MRCPHCGNDVTQAQHACHVCGTVLLVDALEAALPFFGRHEERWRKPMGMFERFKYMLIDPSRAMWDISHKPSPQGPVFIFFMNVLLFGLIGPILLGKLAGSEVWLIYPGFNALAGLGTYFAFVLVGIIQFGILWGLLVVAQTIGVKMVANVVPKWTKQAEVVTWAFVPSIFATGIYVLVVLVGVTAVPVESVPLLFFPAGSTQASGAWLVADIVLIAFYCGYIPVLMAIGFREHYDKPTLKCVLSAAIVAAISAVVFVFTRSTFPIFVLQ